MVTYFKYFPRKSHTGFPLFQETEKNRDALRMAEKKLCFKTRPKLGLARVNKTISYFSQVMRKQAFCIHAKTNGKITFAVKTTFSSF